MAEPGRRGGGRLTTVLLGTAAAVLIAAGLFLAGGAWLGTTTSPPPVAEPPPPRTSASQVVPEPAAAPAPSSAPARPARGLRPQVVVVPALGVRAAVTSISTEAGALTPPSDPQQVGWWSGGSRPGASEGAAVITGHTVHTGGGSFDDLETLSRGDRVVVGSADDEVAYRVASVEVMGKAELARRSASLFSRSGPGRLVLVTCEDWDGTGYRSNVVVTARPS